MAIGRAKSIGIREAFYMTFSYKEIRLCLAIGKPVLIVTGYGVQARVRRSSQDGRRRTVGVQRIGMAIKHHSFLICFAPRPISADRPPFSEVPTHFRKVIHRRKSRVVPSGCG